ncbi:MAG: hypothetical protein PHE17_00505 [Thiothrix sp.]|uniref:sensor histidine kinase n=1 Tax=Thiothrix sp. TaxID=1032 RepID=UPI00261956E4|nr:hypothetical protein [Thiothrix sp.]MDD5391473.1 hypothetical protein [Thiothrix sp.]
MLETGHDKSFIPANVFLLAVLFVMMIEAVVLGIRLQQPWVGVRLEIQGEFVAVTAVDTDSPLAATLAVGEVLSHLEFRGENILLSKPLLVLPLTLRTYADIDALLATQGQLQQAFLSGEPLTLVTQRGQRHVFTPSPHTHIQDLPGVFWWMLLANVVGLMLGVIVWAYKPNTLEANSLLMASISYFVAESVFRIAISKEFYLPPELTVTMAGIEAAGFNLFMLSLFSILCYYPHRVAPRWALPFLAAMLLLHSVNYPMRWWEVPIHSFMLPIIPFVSYATWLFYKQWQKAIGNPLSRATLLTLQLSMLLPAWLIILLHAVPVMLGGSAIIGDVATRSILVAIFAGWAVGILRFRLFDIEYWWLKSLLWIAGGSLVVVLDLVLVGIFQTSATYALGGAVLIAGFLYFPLRQWLLETLLPAERQPLLAALPAFSHAMANATSLAEFERRWRETLLQRLHPLHWEVSPAAIPHTMLSDNGMHLLIPTLDANHAYQFSGKQRASRLFNSADVKNVDALLTIARMASNASETRQQAIAEERQRIMRDLHDSLGAKLLTLTHKLTDPDGKETAKQALMTLRDTIRLSMKTSPLKLEDHLADWRAEIADRAEAAGVQLRWQQSGDIAPHLLTSKQVLEITQLLREAISNALKHAAPHTVSLQFVVQQGQLHILIGNDGKVSEPSEWKAGTGLTTLRSRTQQLGGGIQFQLRHTPRPHNRVQIRVPLQPPPQCP